MLKTNFLKIEVGTEVFE